MKHTIISIRIIATAAVIAIMSAGIFACGEDSTEGETGVTTSGGNLTLGIEEAWVLCNEDANEQNSEEPRCGGMFFTKSGKIGYVIKTDSVIWALSADSGVYSTNGNKLTVSRPGKSETMTYSVSGNKLTLTYSDGGSNEYIKTSVAAPKTENPDQAGEIATTNNCGVDGTADNCKTTVIGSQTWIAENLNRNVSGSWCYDNDKDNCNLYGRLYDWNAATTACPNGWHLPTMPELQKLIDFAGGTLVAWKKLKSTNGWLNNSVLGNGNGTDALGFKGLPGGFREVTVTPCGQQKTSYETCMTYISYKILIMGGYWWTATEAATDTYIGANILTLLGGFGSSMTGFVDVGHKENAMSVRCVKD